MRKLLRRACNCANGGVILGLALLCWVSMPAPKIQADVKVPDFLAAAMWEGCKAQGIKRLRAHIVGKGWRVR
jgi:hypothetical protein